MTRLITSAYFIAPNTAPKKRLIKPNPVISTIFVKAEAKRDNPKGTIKPINRKASICPNVTEVPTVTANCSPKPANKARATSSPAISPTSAASCLKNPFIKPETAPKANKMIITQSIVAIYPKYILKTKRRTCSPV